MTGLSGAELAMDTLGEGEVTFLLCVEENRLLPQALLLCESLRTFGGRYRSSAIVAVAPRPHLALSPDHVSRLEALDVTYRAESLNETASAYGTINRIVVGAWAEGNLESKFLVMLDSDMVWVGEPELVRADVGIRPVDLKGSASSGQGDPLEAYWSRLCALGGIGLDRLPFLETTIDRASIRASYNGGFTVVRRDLGILERTREIFFASRAEHLRPWAGAGLDILASTGFVGRAASEWWGASQAALSVAIWSRTSDVRVYDDRFNIPLHLHVDGTPAWPLEPGRIPILLHYHYLAEPEYREQFRTALARVGCAAEVRGWIEDRLRLFDPT